MPNTVHITGEGGDLTWGWHKAATLGKWTVDGTPGAFTLTATIVGKDDSKVSQRPLEIVTPNGWRWAVDGDTLQIADTTLTALVRPLESAHASVPDRRS